MAVATVRAPFDQLSGKFGGLNGVVAMPQKNGSTNLRDMVNPAQPNTFQQLQARAIMASVGEAYQSLDIEQVAGWKALAAQIFYQDRFQNPYNPNWNNLFSSVNNIRLSRGLTILEDAPAYTPTPPLGFLQSGDIVTSDDASPAQQVTTWFEWPAGSTPTANLPIRLRFTRGSTSPVLQIPDNELRLVATPITDNWGITSAAATFSVVIEAELLNVESGEHIGVEVIVTDLTGVTYQRSYAPNILVAVEP